MEYRKKLWSDTLSVDNLTIFAIDGYGDLFAWKPDDSVVFIEIDTRCCENFASNLSDAIFRRIIEFASGDYVELCSNDEKNEMDSDEAEDFISEDDAITMLRKYNNTFGKFFCEEKKEYINALIQHGFLSEQEAFISEEEVLKLIREWLKVETTARTNISL